MTFTPSIAAAVYDLRPDFTALSIVLHGGRNATGDGESEQLLRSACADVDAAPWAEAHMDAWRDAYRAFGAKPQRTPCSADALRKRAQRDGGLPSLNAVVDLYNAVSLRFALPIGGEDMSGYRGSPSLVVAQGNEIFDTLQDGAPKIEQVDRGEVIWRDDAGATCRRWNWRQGVRTRIADESTDMWFVLEKLEPMPMEALLAAGDALINGLTRLSPTASIQTQVLRA